MNLDSIKLCERLVKTLPKGAVYQPVILPGKAIVRTGHNRSKIQDVIFGLTPVQSFLDVGCNVGHLCYLARQRHIARVVGVEHDPEVCKLTRVVGAAWGFDVIQSDLQTVDLSEGFDVVALLSVLHHRVEKPDLQLCRFAAMALHRLVVEVPITDKRGAVFVPANLPYSYFRWLFSPDDLRQFLFESGFPKVTIVDPVDAYHGKVARKIIVGER